MSYDSAPLSKYALSREVLAQVRQTIVELNDQVQFEHWTAELADDYGRLLDAVATMEFRLAYLQLKESEDLTKED
jgi:hypothetical protein